VPYAALTFCTFSFAKLTNNDNREPFDFASNPRFHKHPENMENSEFAPIISLLSER